MDASEPSINSVSASNLLRLSSYLADPIYRQRAADTTSAFATEMLQHPFLFTSFLDSVVGLRTGIKGSIILGGSSMEELETTVQELREQVPADARTVIASRPGVNDSWLESRNKGFGKMLTDGKTGFFRAVDGAVVEALQMNDVKAAIDDL
jgi:uncharacterized protein YyaL (SSP411 family)